MSQTETSRLVTFETDHSELLAIMAGSAEYDRRTIYRGRVDGRHAVVPVDDLVASHEEGSDSDVDLDLSRMQLVGATVDVPEHGDADVSLAKDGRQVERMDQRGTYGLLWIPFE
jgi:hypothetical protein